MTWGTYQVHAAMARIQREREWEANWLRLLAWEFVWREFGAATAEAEAAEDET